MDQNEIIKKATTKYKLSVEDVYTHKDGWKIITSNGIKKIIDLDKINVGKKLEHVSFENKNAVVRCVVSKGQIGKDYQRYSALGEASNDNNSFSYFVNVAEKRAESRAVLGLTGMYAEGWRGEDEMDEMVAINKLLEKKKELSSAAVIETVKQLSEVAAAPKGKKALRIERKPVVTNETKNEATNIPESDGTVYLDMGESPALQ